jgi:RHS repeat-associated protein
MGLYYFGARYYDARVGRWISPDPAILEYLPTGNKNKDANLPGMGGVFNTVNLSLYHYVANNPVKYIDPDGKKTVWLEGAGPEVNSASYSRPIIQKMAQHGIKNPVWLNFKHQTGVVNQAVRVLNSAMNKVTRSEIDAIKKTYDRSDGQYNLAGYSLGGVRAAQAALEMANEGKVIDNLVLIATPIDKESDLYKSITSNKNIKNVISIDIEGDFLSNEKGNVEVIKFFKNIISLKPYESYPHFYYITNDKGQQDQLVKTMKEKGVK